MKKGKSQIPTKNSPSFFLKKLPMIIIANFFFCITKYVNMGNKFCPHIIGCKCCGYLGSLHKHGSYDRNLLTLHNQHQIKIQRVKCPCCGKTFSILPPFLLPHFQYSFTVIFFVLGEILICKKSYSSISATLVGMNPFCTLTHASFTFYCKRFKLYSPEIHIFFSTLEFSLKSIQNDSETTMFKEIFNYLCSGKNFNLSFSKNRGFCFFKKF